MTQQPSDNSPSVNTQGAVDLSALADQGGGQQGAPQAGRTGGGRDSWVVALQPQQIQQIVQLSAQAPALVLMHGADETSQRFQSVLAEAVDAQGGRIVLATLDVTGSPELAQQAGQLPVVTAFLSGKPIGEFDSQAPAEQLPQLVTQILQLGTQQGVTGTVPAQSTRQDPQAEQEEEQLPPLHQKAQDCLEEGDYDGAAAAYRQALKENPADEEAKLGIAQVQLIIRTQDADVAAVRTRAADAPDDVSAQTAVADVDVLGGHVEDAFARLVRFIQAHPGDDRETARKHLVELYSIVGDHDPRVSVSRRKLANALF